MAQMSLASKQHCYCHRPRQSMDVDMALNELGMLSSVTDIRKQYVAERNRRRQRQCSEPGTSNSASLAMDNFGMTPSNSPDKNASSTTPTSGYQVIQINPQFVTGLSSGLNQIQVTHPPELQTAPLAHTFGSNYSQEYLDREAGSRRLTRMKVSRIHRFRKPYEYPWLQRHSIDVYYGGDSVENENSSDSGASEDKTAGAAASSSSADSNLCLFSNADKTRPKDKASTSSNTSSPEKTVNVAAVSRSKSLDDLDFSKLRLAEAENHNFIQEKNEIDSVAQHMQNLKMNE